MHNIAIDQKDMEPTVFVPGFADSLQQTSIASIYHDQRAGRESTVRDHLMVNYFQPMLANETVPHEMNDE